MDFKTAIDMRHAVRKFTTEPLHEDVVQTINKRIEEINGQSGLQITLVTNEPKAFKSFLSKIGGFQNVTNYLVLAAPKGNDYKELVGYYGEELVLLAMTMGVHSCWVANSYKLKNKSDFIPWKGGSIPVVIALGYGQDNGALHRSKPFTTLSKTPKEAAPSWYVTGVRAAMAAPTAMNQQKFQLELLENNRVSLTSKGKGIALVDKGIVKFHFEVGAGLRNFQWN